MTTELLEAAALDVSRDIEALVDAYTEDDRESFSEYFHGRLKSSDLVKMLDATSPTGPGSLCDVLNVCREIGKVDASLAWIVGVSNSAWSMRSCFHSLPSPNASMEENKLLAMVLGRPGTLKYNGDSGKYYLSGDWKYASGWPYASYFFCLAALEGSDGKDVRVVAVPADKMSLVESWNSTGLRGTQSVTVHADAIEIPDSNMEDYNRILSGENRVIAKSSSSDRHTHASYSGLFSGVLMNCLLGSMLGAAEAALEYVVAESAKRPVTGSTFASMGDSGAIRSEIGRLYSAFDMCVRAADYNANVIDQAARDDEMKLTTRDRVNSRARATMVMRGCLDIVQDVLWIYGSGGLDRGSPLERIWRDVNVGARHGGFSKLVPEETLGITMLERDPTTITRMF